jgi:hypothetical protein
MNSFYRWLADHLPPLLVYYCARRTARAARGMSVTGLLPQHIVEVAANNWLASK